MANTQGDGVPNSPLNWLMYLNPGPKELAEGVVVGPCSDWCPKAMTDPEDDNIACGHEMAYGLARYVLEGSDPNDEALELRRFLRSNYIGKQVVTIDSELETLSDENLDDFVRSVGISGKEIAAAATYMSENTKAFTQDVVESLPENQREATLNIYNVNQRINQLRRGDDASGLITEMQEALRGAIDEGLHEYGLIIRHAVAYGVGDYLLEKFPEGAPIVEHLETVIH